MPDQLSSLYGEFLEGGYDCVDRIVCNAYFSMGQSGGGFRMWWRELHGSDENLDNNHLMRMAGRFSRRLRAWAKEKNIPVIYCSPGEDKHKIAEQHLASHEVKSGLFLVLASKAPALVWEVQQTGTGKLGQLVPKQPWPYVNHYSFHIWDPDWGHVTIKMSGHPPFGAQIILNGHEYVAVQARKARVTFLKRRIVSPPSTIRQAWQRLQTPCPKRRPQGSSANSASVGFTAPACVLRWIWKNRRRAHFSINTLFSRWSIAEICCSAPDDKWKKSSTR